MDDLVNEWKNAKNEPAANQPDPETIIRKAESTKKASRSFHIGNIIILCIVALLLAAFLVLVAPVQESLSHLALVLMFGGLLARIIIEVISHRKLQHIDVTQTSAKANREALNFYTFRKRVHGPVTVAIIIAYVIGVGLLLPEFSKYLTTNSLLLYYAGFVVWGLIFIFFIRKKIGKETAALRGLSQIKASLDEG
ncbi:MAG: hypothetical protein WBB45_02370 [Cyclobacteriaceae bacterium]